MQDAVKITFKIGTNDPGAALGMEIWVDDQRIFDLSQVTETLTLSHIMSDDEGEHVLKFVMKNKNTDHTKLDELGNMVSDARLTVSDIEFDEISLGQVFVEQAVYEHNFNGNGKPTQDKFYGEMGCNGSVSLKFSTPVYLWLLENM